jgi:hypothetical protein
MEVVPAAKPTGPSALPPALLAQRILALLPADARARCATVCREWRAALADPSLWTRLDLSDTSGVRCTVRDGALRGASARAGGALQTLDLHRAGPFYCSREALLEVAAANAGSLRTLRTRWLLDAPPPRGVACALTIRSLLALLRSGALPALRELSAAAECGPEQAPALLRNDAPYGPLRLHSLHVRPPALEDSISEARLLELVAALRTHATLRSLTLSCAPLASAAACDALAEAVCAARLRAFELQQSTPLPPDAAPGLARLLRCGALTGLHLRNSPGLLEEPELTALLASALHDNATLTALSFSGMHLWRARTFGAVLLRALAGHPRLRELRVTSEAVCQGGTAAGVGAALGALVAANAPALTALELPRCELNDAVLGPLCDALPRNTHLRRLDISGDMYISQAFAADRLLPALRANASLRELRADAPSQSVAEAVRLVQARAAAAESAAGAHAR